MIRLMARLLQSKSRPIKLFVSCFGIWATSIQEVCGFMNVVFKFRWWVSVSPVAPTCKLQVILPFEVVLFWRYLWPLLAGWKDEIEQMAKSDTRRWAEINFKRQTMRKRWDETDTVLSFPKMGYRWQGQRIMWVDYSFSSAAGNWNKLYLFDVVVCILTEQAREEVPRSIWALLPHKNYNWVQSGSPFFSRHFTSFSK